MFFNSVFCEWSKRIASDSQKIFKPRGGSNGMIYIFVFRKPFKIEPSIQPNFKRILSFVDITISF